MRHKSLREMYLEEKKRPTHAASFITTVAEVTHHSKAAVRKWLLGFAKPDMNTKIILSKHFNAPYDELFPEDGEEVEV